MGKNKNKGVHKNKTDKISHEVDGKRSNGRANMFEILNESNNLGVDWAVTLDKNQERKIKKKNKKFKAMLRKIEQ
jgi:hypothetical protein